MSLKALKFALAGCLALVVTSSAVAGPVFLNLVVNPGTTAGGGNTSSRSGAGTWHLYALDTVDGSLGIHSYGVTLTNITQVLNRSPLTGWDDADPDNGPYQAGFSAARTANDTTPPVGAASNPVGGSQHLPGNQPIYIAGFGREASTWAAELPVGSTVNPVGQIGASWGTNATAPSAHPWLFLAEGNWLGGANPLPGFGTSNVVLYQTIDNENQTRTFVPSGSYQIQFNQLPPADNTPPTIVDYVEPNPIHASIPGSYSHQMTVIDPDAGDPPGSHTWSGLALQSYTPAFGGANPPNTPPPNAASLSGSGLFSWNTVGAARGTYVWTMAASDGDASDPSGTITLNVTQVPEPATFALVGLAMVGLVGVFRRR
jgi:hypothetical protein